MTALNLTIHALCFNEDDGTALLNFFANQNKLKSIEISMNQREGDLDNEILKSVYLHIVDHCPALRKLKFPTYHHDQWLNQVSLLAHDRTLNLDYLSVGSIKQVGYWRRIMEHGLPRNWLQCFKFYSKVWLHPSLNYHFQSFRWNFAVYFPIHGKISFLYS